MSNLEYPYRRLTTTDADIARAFAAVRAYTLKFVHRPYSINNLPHYPRTDLQYLGRQTLVALSPSDYETMTWLSDIYNEHVRVRCRRYDEPQTPLQYWNEHRANLTHTDPRALSDAVYRHVRGCGNFRPNLLSGFIKHWHVRSILDPCMGWGDRLLAALSLGIPYTGTDPNPDLHPGYSAMISQFATSPAQYTHILAPFESATLPPATYDLVFTSPPYFDLEEYGTDPNQSIIKYPTLDAWLAGFLYPLLTRSWSHLNPGGRLVIVLNIQRGGPDYITSMIRAMPRLCPTAVYEGVISYAEISGSTVRSPQPMWIWHKPHTPTPEFLYRDRAAPMSSLPPEYTPHIITPGEWDSIPTGHLALLAPPARIDTPDSIYHGEIALDATYSVWERIPPLDPSPPITLSTVQGFTVVRDDLLPGGTKQRAHAIVTLPPAKSARTLVYAGPWNGYAQVALAVACKLHSKHAVIFTGRDDYPTNIRARMYGAEIHAHPNTPLRELQSLAEEWAARHNALMLPFGFDSPQFRDTLLAELCAKIPVSHNEYTGRVWLVAGSGTLLSVLYRLFPRAKFGVVQVGKKIWPDQLEPDRTTLYIAPETFYQDAKIPPPYPSVPTYDAKVWQFVREHGARGDLIWNVAGHT